jgi:hypothetical protein
MRGCPLPSPRWPRLRRRSLPFRRTTPCAAPLPWLLCCVVVSGRASAHRAVFGVVLARPEKQAIGPCLGRQLGPTPDTARHEDPIGPHSVGPHRAGLDRARAGLGTDGPFGILYAEVQKCTCAMAWSGHGLNTIVASARTWFSRVTAHTPTGCMADRLKTAGLGDRAEDLRIRCGCRCVCADVWNKTPGSGQDCSRGARANAREALRDGNG